MSASYDPRAYPVLVVDDEPDILEIFELNYGRQFTVRTAASGRAALGVVAAEPIAVLVADQRMPGMSGLELIRRAREIRPELLPIVLTGYTDVGALVDAINLGCIRRYIPKPFEPKELGAALAQAIEAYHLTRQNAELSAENARLVAELSRANERLAQENRYLKQRGAEGSGFDAIVGRSAAIRTVVEHARRVLDAPTTVLLEGATGTGKELVARAIHYEGPRRGKLFVAVNTASVTESLLASTLFGHRRGAFTGALTDQKGLFEIADGGTLFLDEIGETAPAFQVHLLRVLQEGEVMPVGATRPVQVDVRVIAATNRNLEEDVRRGRFREDLLHRLRVFPIRCPTLAERREDIPLLAEHALAKLAARLKKPAVGFAPEALSVLVRHPYAGNVRELENLIERALLLCAPGQPIATADLFERLPAHTVAEPGALETLQDAVGRFEQDRIRATLAECGGNKTQAARRLGLTYRGFLMKLHRYGMVNGGAERVA